MLETLAGLPAFLTYFCVSAAVVIGYVYLYTWMTPHDEFALIRSNVPGAAISLGLSLLGFSLPVASAIAHAANIVDCVVWSLIALAVQIVAFYMVKIPIPDLSKRIAQGELAAAIWLGLASLAAGVLS